MRQIDLFSYIIRNYWTLLNSDEQEFITSRLKNQKKNKNSILLDSDATFEKEVISRILTSENNIFINTCPFCGELARTPTARSAKCGHTWYEKK